MTESELTRRGMLGVGSASVAGLVLAGHSGQAAAGQKIIVLARSADTSADAKTRKVVVRRDLARGRPGRRIRLLMTVRDARGKGQPVARADVEVWHCDAEGNYPSDPDTALHGRQRTDNEGRVEFRTITPGTGPQQRTRHIHVRVREDDGSCHAGQLPLDDEPPSDGVVRTVLGVTR